LEFFFKLEPGRIEIENDCPILQNITKYCVILYDIIRINKSIGANKFHALRVKKNYCLGVTNGLN